MSVLSAHEVEMLSGLIAKQLSAGIFLSVGGEKPNTMTIGWGGYAFYWKRPMIIAPIRPQRFTHDLLMKTQAFTLSIPDGNMKAELAKAGTLSGRDGNKFQAIGLQTQPGRLVDAPVIEGCAWHLECRVLASPVFDGARMDPTIAETFYPGEDFHTLFHGEILACYPSA